jgi:2-dehydro-3-deoxyphosphogluconate aldolase/(4S)-4-hydroxy-2-oxoglutarate aldolase
MKEVLEEIRRIRVIPVVAIRDSRHAEPLGEALIRGGLPCAEITFRTEAAADSIRSLVRRGDLLVGAGTVLTVDQAKTAIDVGARFIVSPGFSLKVVQYCIDHQILVTPGVCTPTDISNALECGLEVVKFFPAEAFGGLKTLKAVSGPFPGLRFIPTGGIGPKNLVEYLTFPKVLAVGGSWIAEADQVSAGRFEEIARLARQAVELAAQAPVHR